MLSKIACGRAWEQLSRSGSLAGIWNVTTGHGRACVAGHSSSHLHNSAAANSEFPVYVFRLPKLSPAMQSARITKWHIAAGEDVEEPHLAITLIPDRLETLESSDVQKSMQVEIHDEGVMAVILEESHPQRSIQCGAALGLICDREHVAELQHAWQSGRDLIETATRETAWQAFIAS